MSAFAARPLAQPAPLPYSGLWPIKVYLPVDVACFQEVLTWWHLRLLARRMRSFGQVMWMRPVMAGRSVVRAAPGRWRKIGAQRNKRSQKRRLFFRQARIFRHKLGYRPDWRPAGARRDVPARDPAVGGAAREGPGERSEGVASGATREARPNSN
jgi:hypothetical protein